MRVAVYHNLPPGGALRVLDEFLKRSNDEHEYDLYAIELGRFDGFAYANGRAEQHDVAAHVSKTFRYPVADERAATLLGRRMWLATAPAWIGHVERRIAADINDRNYQVALIYSCQVTHTPSVLRHLTVPSLYYMNEPRRQSFEPGYRPAVRTPPIQRIVTSGREWALRRSDRISVAAADRIATNSYYSADSIERAYGIRASVCYLGIDTATFDLAPGDQPADDHRTVISVGALDPVKGHDLVVRALGLLHPAIRPALHVVYERCDPAYRAELQALAAANGVDLQLHFGISDAELATRYRKASATVLAARLEPFGLVPLESLACGTPVVAVREGGFRETVEHEVNGFLVDRSPAAIAQGVDRLLNGGIQRTSQQLRSTVVPRWGWDDAAKRQLELLAMTAEEHRR